MASETMDKVIQQVAALTSPLSLDEKLTIVTFLIEQAKQDAAKSNGEAPANETSQEINREAEVAESSVSDGQVEFDRYRLREYEWLRRHREEYAGQYVALAGDRLVAHGPDGRTVLRQAREAGVKVPFMVRIEAPDELPWGGW